VDGRTGRHPGLDRRELLVKGQKQLRRARRFTQTIKAIRAELAQGPLLYRFSGAAEIEGAFVACSFWLVDALVRNGQLPQATKVWGGLTGYVSDLGLLAEEIDPATGAFLGNFPQGLPHLALLNAAALLEGARPDEKSRR
jgi:GH15 family glucan-1,4-alpha-glucosidase